MLIVELSQTTRSLRDGGAVQLPDGPVISIVEDDESVRLAIKSLLNSVGLATHLFASAEEFLQSPYVSETSCLILDVQMPGMGGIELQRVLISQGLSTPIIFITAFPEERIRTRVLEAGAICFLSKPFDEQVLLDCLASALKRNKDADSAQ
jgi:FixJ family two-component response regulator